MDLDFSPVVVYMFSSTLALKSQYRQRTGASYSYIAAAGGPPISPGNVMKLGPCLGALRTLQHNLWKRDLSLSPDLILGGAAAPR